MSASSPSCAFPLSPALLRFSSLVRFAVVICLAFFASTSSAQRPQDLRPHPGAVRDVPDWETSIPDILETASFALDEHNRINGLTEESGTRLSLEKIVSVKHQVVSGIIYYITLQVKEGSEHKLYEAKVWVKAWLNFKALMKLTFLKNIVPSADFGSYTHGSMHSPVDKEFKETSLSDPETQQVVKKAVELLQQQSNSLFPYEIAEVTSAKKQILEFNGQTSFELVLKLKRGTLLENAKIEIYKNNAGRWFLKQALFY